MVRDQIVELDSRGRVSLGRLGVEHPRYLAHIEADGTVVLTPAVVVSALEAKVLSDPDLVARIRAGLTDEDEIEVERAGPTR